MLISAPQYILPPELVQELKNEYGILHLLYHRNHNQHHVATWWKDLNKLHRGVRKILRKIIEFEEAKKYAVKKRIHGEALAIAHYMIKKQIFKSCYYSFNSIVALGQFITLGMTLLASLSAFHSLVMSMDGITETLHSVRGPQNTKTVASTEKDQILAEDDLGEEVVFIEKQPTLSPSTKSPVSESKHTATKREHVSIESIFDGASEKKKEKRQKSKKPKKKKNAIDDIFG